MTLTVPNELGNIIVARSCFLETTHISINNLFANRLMHFQIFEVHPMRTSFFNKILFSYNHVDTKLPKCIGPKI